VSRPMMSKRVPLMTPCDESCAMLFPLVMRRKNDAHIEEKGENVHQSSV
jgi:hypothetical protein